MGNPKSYECDVELIFDAGDTQEHAKTVRRLLRALQAAPVKTARQQRVVRRWQELLTEAEYFARDPESWLDLNREGER